MDTKSNIILKWILYSWIQKQNDIVTWYRRLKINLVVEFQYYILSGTAIFLSLLNRGTERVQEQYKIKTYFSRCGVLPILKVESTSCASRIKFVRCPMGGTNMSSPWLRNDTFHVRKISLASVTNEQRLLRLVVDDLLQRLFSVPIYICIPVSCDSLNLHQ